MWPAPLLSFLLQSLLTRWTHNCSLVHTHDPLTFISSFPSLWKFLSESHVPYYTVHPALLTMVWYQIKNGRKFHKRFLHLWDPQMSSFFLIVSRSSWTEWVSVDLQELVDHKSFCGLDNLFSCSILPAELAWSWVSISMIKISGPKYLSLDETFQEWWGKNNSYKLHWFLCFSSYNAH